MAKPYLITYKVKDEASFSARHYRKAGIQKTFIEVDPAFAGTVRVSGRNRREIQKFSIFHANILANRLSGIGGHSRTSFGMVGSHVATGHSSECRQG